MNDQPTRISNRVAQLCDAPVRKLRVILADLIAIDADSIDTSFSKGELVKRIVYRELQRDEPVRKFTKEQYVVALKAHVEQTLRDAYDDAREEGLDEGQTDHDLPNASQRRIQARLAKLAHATSIHGILMPLSEEWDGDMGQLIAAAIAAVVDGVKGGDTACL